ncbi:hypothetical protein ONS96_004847 [Cadophora gregata f. sp. sojae]|nr:hypothetical protein ONS96_004847 [Cadophora gregata f. sp. sojae]
MVRVYGKETMKAIRACQAGGEDKKMKVMRPDKNGKYQSGDPDQDWWEDCMLYNPEVLPKSLDDIPRFCFLSDRVIAVIAENIAAFTNEQRHEYWPGDFANGGHINKTTQVRANHGAPAMTPNGEIISFFGTHPLIGNLKATPPKQGGHEMKYAVANTLKANDEGHQPTLFNAAVSHDPQLSDWYYSRVKVVPKKPAKVKEENEDKKDKGKGKTHQRIGSKSQVLQGTSTSGMRSPSNPFQTYRKPRRRFSLSPRPPKSENFKREGKDDPEVENFGEDLEDFGDDVKRLRQENKALKKELKTSRNAMLFTIQFAGSIHQDRVQIAEMVGDLVDNIEDRDKYHLEYEKYEKMVDNIDRDVRSFDDWPNFKNAMFHKKDGFGGLAEKHVMPVGWDLRDDEVLKLSSKQKKPSDNVLSRQRRTTDEHSTENIGASSSPPAQPPKPSRRRNHQTETGSPSARRASLRQNNQGPSSRNRKQGGAVPSGTLVQQESPEDRDRPSIEDEADEAIADLEPGNVDDESGYPSPVRYQAEEKHARKPASFKAPRSPRTSTPVGERASGNSSSGGKKRKRQEPYVHGLGQLYEPSPLENQPRGFEPETTDSDSSDSDTKEYRRIFKRPKSSLGGANLRIDISYQYDGTNDQHKHSRNSNVVAEQIKTKEPHSTKASRSTVHPNAQPEHPTTKDENDDEGFAGESTH